MNRLLILFFIIVSFFSFSIVHGQGVPVNPTGLSISTSSNYPNPGQKVTITARSYSIDINSSTITWTVNGKVIKKGIGETSLDVVAPDLGKSLIIEVTATSPSEIVQSASITINSGSVDMIIESDGYVPPLFKGKLPVVYQNNTKIIAIPHLADQKGVEYDPKSLVYQWKKNSRVVEDQSGYGKQSFTLQGEIVPRTASINVTVSTKDGTQQAIGYITVPYTSPSLVFYVDDPLYGPLFNTSLGENIYIGKEKEKNVLAIPYGFTKSTIESGSLNFTWLINGLENTDLSKNQSITLRSPDSSSGSSNLELTVRNSREILQEASAGFAVRFGQSN